MAEKLKTAWLKDNVGDKIVPFTTANEVVLDYTDSTTLKSTIGSINTKLNNKVAKTTKINGKPLSTNITLTASDVSAYTKTEIDNLVLISVLDIDLICGYFEDCCFAPGTQILVSIDGEAKSIETLQKGDTIVSYNIYTDEIYMATIKGVIVNNNTTDIAEVYFDNGSMLKMNAYHPIYTNNGFHSITKHNGYEELVAGDVCRTQNGWSTVTNIIRYNSEPIATYNLDVIDVGEDPDYEENDTFFANGIVVHNASCK